MEQGQKSEFRKLLRRRLPQYLAAFAACMGGFSLGCAIGWSAPCVELLKNVHEYGAGSVNWIASSLLIGAPMGLLVVPFLIDKIGRKWTMLSLVPVFLLGWVFIVAGLSVFAVILVGRILTGACGAMFCVVAPMYSAEISETSIRGSLGTFFQLLLVTGILYAYCSGYSRDVTVVSLFCGCSPIVFACIMVFMPESPLYYLSKGNEEAAKKAMRFFRGPDYDIDPDLRALKDQVERSKQGTSISAFLKKPVMKTMGVAFLLMWAQQFSGINAIIFFAETIFKLTGVDMEALLQMVIFGVVQLVSCAASALLIDKLGRKLLMMISSGAMCICMASLGVYFVLRNNDPEVASNLFWLPLTSACLYILAFSLGAGPVPWAYMGEIFPAKLKGTASSIAAITNWIMAFIVTSTFSSLVDAFGAAATFFVYSIFCALSVLLVKMLMIETKGKPLTEILQEYGTYDLDR